MKYGSRVGKPIDRDVFIDSIRMWYVGDIDKKQASQMCDLSVPTWEKRVNQFCTNGDLPNELWKTKKKTQAEIEEEEFWNALSDAPVEEISPVIEEKKVESKWQLSNFKNM